MFENIEYQVPYFNDTDALRKAFKSKYPNYDFDMISSLMVGAMSVYIPEIVFDKLILDTLKSNQN
jgi:hypothetical protein